MRSDQIMRVTNPYYNMPTSLDGLFCDCGEIVNFDIPTEVLESYSSTVRDRSSSQHMSEISNNNASSTQRTTSVGGTKNLHSFKYNELPEKFRPEFMSFSFDESCLERFVKDKLGMEFHSTKLPIIIGNLNKIRSIIYSVQCVKSSDLSPTATWQESRIQCMMQLFLNDLFNKVDGKLVAMSANGDPIEFSMDDLSFKGYSDVKCLTTEDNSIYSAVATVEMKVPFGRFNPKLYHSNAQQPKQQLLGQSIGLLNYQPDKSTPNNESTKLFTMSYLTDMIAISFLFHQEGVAYLSSRVTDARGFCLRLLLMCCNPSIDDWDTVLAGEVGSETVDLGEDDDEEMEMIQEAPGKKMMQNIGTGPQTRSRSVSGKKSCGNISDQANVYHATHTCGAIEDNDDDEEEEEAHHRRLVDITNMRRWEAKCQGVNYLGVDEMKQRDKSML